ncbi:HD domain-containing phosphohydrolase [Salinicola rhizosphaerae]|uniref:HD-GYP domain-containing protein n=1 Tax=Salinicola rhizosphaerae TaxID=1443141 RepID=A0ABQ3ECR2_9GAMM|nr:HD domain-containing phosphohydrolase [Salinicola rhizosphaerae]GHB32251.1 hypothetical protein GCM10009038_33780 [Salinicola rhizosphaerae]
MGADSTPTDVVTLEDASDISRILSSIQDDIYSLTVSFGRDETHFPATLSDIEFASRSLSLEAVDAQSLDLRTLAGSSLSLRVDRLSEAVTFEGGDIVDAGRRGDNVNLVCGMPTRMLTQSKRREVRASLINGMQARATVTVLEGQPPIVTRLKNLSVGGCLVAFPLRHSAPFRIDMLIPSLELAFPNGDRLSVEARIRHVTAPGRSNQVLVGFSFENLSPEQQQRVVHFVDETEQEIGYRQRETGRLAWPSPLYRLDAARAGRFRERRRGKVKEPPMVPTIREVSRQIHLSLLKLHQRRPLPTAMLYLSADKLLKLLKQNRQDFLYSLHCLDDEPGWVQHSVCVAGRLADLMMAEQTLAPLSRDAIVGALLHDLGKAMLLSNTLPSLIGALSRPQKQQIRGHVGILAERLDAVGWKGKPATRLVIEQINERLDGSGYPRQLQAESLSPLARAAAVVDVIDAMTRARGDRKALTAIEVYRYLYHRPETFDRHWVTRYIQRQGFYPIGSLIRFSRGFLGWVMALTETGQPARVHVVFNGANGTPLDEIVSRIDFHLLGKPEGLVRPEAYDLGR